MRLNILLIILIGVSCKPKAVDEELIISILENYIEEDSLYSSDYIYPELLPYIYYQPEYSDDGLEHPTPPPSYEGEYLNEIKFIERLECEKYFSYEDSSHIKHQIFLSSKIFSTLNLSSLSKREFEFSPDEAASWYAFYLPVFNNDSSAVYVQYDYQYEGVGYGNGAILVKKNGHWIMVKFISRWMT
ncbi:hypothetical protein [Catalinimonas niigatensis]|uniref:hypothetical protein n=1 Tax=Catalinimonas niigatensis TaxID=1397264 RepID=UPI0026656B4A|nr:hypothetical protein [Catalinimonas niigatensis]WPP52206.1 hypothetical protein PZB72_07415 [Catalinimonas niigatensis]